jgi:hypothetical protein
MFIDCVTVKKHFCELVSRIRKKVAVLRSQSYNFGIYNASVAVGWRVF